MPNYCSHNLIDSTVLNISDCYLVISVQVEFPAEEVSLGESVLLDYNSSSYTVNC